MDPKTIAEKVSEAKKASKKRNFSQTIDMIVTLKEIDLKNVEQQVDFYATLPHQRGKKTKVGAFIGPELVAKAEGVYDTIIREKEFDTLKANKTQVKALAEQNSFFIAQANLMPRVAASFGKVLGPKGKMPNPKAGCVVDLKTDVKGLYEKLQKLVKVSIKAQAQFQCAVGTEDMSDNILAENIHSLYDQLIHHLPKGEINVGKVYVKVTMGAPIEVN